jgi:hypothetical protein
MNEMDVGTVILAANLSHEIQCLIADNARRRQECQVSTSALLAPRDATQRRNP